MSGRLENLDLNIVILIDVHAVKAGHVLIFEIVSNLLAVHIRTIHISVAQKFCVFFAEEHLGIGIKCHPFVNELYMIVMTVRQKETGYLPVMVLAHVFLNETVRVRSWVNNNAWLALFTDDIHVADVIAPDVKPFNFHKKNKAQALFICIPYGVSFYCSVCKTSFFPSC